MAVLRITSRSLAAALIGAAITAGAATATVPHLGFVTGGTLNGIAAASKDAVWAVGTTSSGRALVLRWNGSGWTKSTPVGGTLNAVAAVSATNVWAVGAAPNGTSLILHWNGQHWVRVAGPSPGTGATLNGIAAISARDIWAVGGYFARSERTLTVHWAGSSWRRVPSPSGNLNAVAANSARNVWAVGSRFVPRLNASRTLALHWTGGSWMAVPSPGPVGNGAGLNGVTAAAIGRTWAVGCTGCAFGGFAASVAARWSGSAWRVPAGGRVSGGDLLAVTTVRNGSAWAVGGRYAQPGASQSVRTFIRFWNGTGWSTQRGASPGAEAVLRAVTASSATDAWAVGSYDRTAGNGASTRTLILHWNGTAWR